MAPTWLSSITAHTVHAANQCQMINQVQYLTLTEYGPLATDSHEKCSCTSLRGCYVHRWYSVIILFLHRYLMPR